MKLIDWQLIYHFKIYFPTFSIRMKEILMDSRWWPILQILLQAVAGNGKGAAEMKLNAF